MKKRIAKFLLLLCCLIAVSHYFAKGWVRVEDYISFYVAERKQKIINNVAISSGYVLPHDNLSQELSIDDIIEQECLRRKINPSLVRAIIKQESDWNSLAQSSAGAIGLMQVMPQNASFCGLSVAELFDAKKNVICGIQVLEDALKAQQNNVVNALMYYNGGNVCFDSTKKIAKCKETKKYPTLVINYMARDIRG